MYDSVCRGLQSIQEILFRRFATAPKLTVTAGRTDVGAVATEATRLCAWRIAPSKTGWNVVNSW
jgi:hypothetical protein